MTSDGLAAVRRLVTANLPGYQVETVVQLGEGQENIAYEVNADLIVRLSKQRDPAKRSAGVVREAAVLDYVRTISQLPIPNVRFTSPDEGCLAYTKLSGNPLLDIPAPMRAAHASSIAGAIGELLAALHAMPVERTAKLVQTDDQPLAGWLTDALQSFTAVAEVVPLRYHRPIRAFLDAEPPAGGYTTVFSHNDLGIEHILVDPIRWAVTGVIDWGDAAVDDPAYDFGLLYRDLGAAAFDAAVSRYPPAAVPGLRERARFYARCSVLEDLAYGIETKRRPYIEKSLDALGWLFSG